MSIFLYHPDAGLFCNDECADLYFADSFVSHQRDLLDPTADHDFDDDSDDHYYEILDTDNNGEVIESIPHCGHCCDQCGDVVWN